MTTASKRCRVVIAFAFGLAVASQGCTRVLDDPAEIAGTYVLNRGPARDIIVLQPQGRYVRTYAPPGGATVTESGTWEVDRSSGEPRVVLSDWVPRWRAQHFPNVPMRPGYWSTPAERGFGGAVRLNVSRDNGLAYIRK